MVKRIDYLKQFYAILERLEKRVGHTRILSTSTGWDTWPDRGVYFFFELGETRSSTGSGLRVTRVGTHALKKGAGSTLWSRLLQHRGTVKNGGGNHRGSIFRLLVGTAIINSRRIDCPTWGKKSTASKEVRNFEQPLEMEVSKIIGRMPFIFLAINDEPGPDSMRGYIERNSIALLSNLTRDPLDEASCSWLGRKCDREKVRLSGLWNQNHADEIYDPGFLRVMTELVTGLGSKS